jgi:hypothetical protein
VSERNSQAQEKSKKEKDKMKREEQQTTSVDENADCLGCKVVGTVTMGSIAAYMLHLRFTAKNPNHKLFYTACSIGMCHDLAVS